MCGRLGAVVGGYHIEKTHGVYALPPLHSLVAVSCRLQPNQPAAACSVRAGGRRCSHPCATWSRPPRWCVLSWRPLPAATPALRRPRFREPLPSRTASVAAPATAALHPRRELTTHQSLPPRETAPFDCRCRLFLAIPSRLKRPRDQQLVLQPSPCKAFSCDAILVSATTAASFVSFSACSFPSSGTPLTVAQLSMAL